MPSKNKDRDLYLDIGTESAENDDVIELGPRNPSQISLSERLRTRITPPEVLQRTFDLAVKRLCQVDNVTSEMSYKVPEEVFDADVQKIISMSEAELLQLDEEVCFARKETRSEGGGVYVDPSKASGFGSDVFGFAYEVHSGKWITTNRCGLHGHCAEFLQMEFEDGDVPKPEYLSGYIFQLESIQTPVITLFAYAYNTPAYMGKAVEDILSWKKFIILDDFQKVLDRQCYQLMTAQQMVARCEAYHRREW